MARPNAGSLAQGADAENLLLLPRYHGDDERDHSGSGRSPRHVKDPFPDTNIRSICQSPGSQTKRLEERLAKNTQTSPGTLSVLAHVTSNIEFHSQRIRLAFNKAPRQQLFEDFGDQNTRLRDILGSSDRLASLRRARVSNKSPTANAGLWKFWNHGNLLFNLLTEAW